MGWLSGKRKPRESEVKSRKKRYVSESMQSAFLSQKDRVIEKQKAMLKTELDRLPDIDLKSIEYFHGIADIYGNRLVELQEFKKKGGKVVGMLCVLAPAEIIYAAGAVPVRLCSGEQSALSARRTLSVMQVYAHLSRL